MHAGRPRNTLAFGRARYRSPAVATAAQAKGVVRIGTIDKGLILGIDAPASAVLTGTTKLGNFSMELEKLRRKRTATLLDGTLQPQCAAVATALNACITGRKSQRTHGCRASGSPEVIPPERGTGVPTGAQRVGLLIW
jgi:hypothetical protein